MNLKIYRGTHQIGGSCLELSTANTRLIFDIGQELPSLNGERRSQILPGVKGLYKDELSTIDAIFISHGHSDHLGLFNHINSNIPLFIGENAAKLQIVTARFTNDKQITNPLNYLLSGQKIMIGDFSVTPYLVDHSGFDSYAFVIKAEGKCIVYTGDFRDHGRKKKATDYFRQSIPKGVNVLVSEGTMINRQNERIATEEQIEQQAYQFMIAKERPILVLQSGTNIDRLVGMYKAAKHSGRIFVIDIFVAHIVSQLGGSIPRPGKFKDIRVFYPNHLTYRMFGKPGNEKLMKEFNRYYIGKKELGERKDYCMLIRDSMLDDLQYIKNLKGSGMIYSMWSGYTKTQKVQQLLRFAQAQDMEVTYLHTSGHASMKALQTLAESCNPERIIPIHTEKPEQFMESFKNVFIANDGEIILI